MRSRLSVQRLNLGAGTNPHTLDDSQTAGMARRSTGTRLAARAYSALPALHSAMCDRSPLVQRRDTARFTGDSLEDTTARFGEIWVRYIPRYSELRNCC